MNKKIIPVILFSIGFLNIHAQTLPKIQESSLRAPDNIKIDGKASEWNDQLQAYNTATDLFYTIANDDKNLYLIIQAKKALPVTKIGQKGITFTIQRSGKKEYNDGMGITYPTTKLTFIFLAGPYNPATADSLMLKSNNLIRDMVKDIRVTGIKDIDTSISVYNEQGIKAVCLFDNKRVLTYELAIPLKVLGLSLNDPIKFAYNVRLNGLSMSNPQFNDTENAMAREALSRATAMMSAVTDFWGEYTLAKKP